jgi:ADP-ribose pyrophosphatase YjhB (NUDIX family)
MASQHPEVCVGCVVIHDGQILLVQRGSGAAVGAWSVPGGRVELGETLEQAARRELAEETGLVAGSLRYLGHVERIGAGWHFVIHDFVADVEDAGALAAGDDAADAAWVPLDDVGTWPGVVPGLVAFLHEHGITDA